MIHTDLARLLALSLRLLAVDLQRALRSGGDLAIAADLTEAVVMTRVAARRFLRALAAVPGSDGDRVDVLTLLAGLRALTVDMLDPEQIGREARRWEGWTPPPR